MLASRTEEQVIAGFLDNKAIQPIGPRIDERERLVIATILSSSRLSVSIVASLLCSNHLGQPTYNTVELLTEIRYSLRRIPFQLP